MGKFLKKNYLIIIFIIIQTIFYIIAGFNKEYLHIDEAYSFGLTHYDKVEIQENSDFFDNWHTKEYYNKYLSMQKDEVGDFKPVYENQKNDVHPPVYYLLLKAFMNFNIRTFFKMDRNYLEYNYIYFYYNIYVYDFKKII